ncbi:hypothetical protein IM42_00805 [Fervidobacterium sp. SC_NGM5_O18]|uniref:Uncharacterized protein n=2 Tax=Fervidobacterium TaxID=2422 RepID=A7HMR9_FERNB|nr:MULTISPECIES: hypothetical protein [Fervidobacterium]ABS61202.1 hypothetical protein Fnod_1355 [Fervidobacterium nodosum Rt17-B1]PHJ13307.1 hypothetical protein IM42_00805 [Fervidobacterium sp. SC_NGM5_O18]SHN64965.1 hypothetical protein SAMN02745226_01472 [Fervidobacterium gondwanense DSM 13020]
MSLDSLVGYMMFSVIISVVTLVLAIAYGVVIYFAIRKTREMLLEIHSSSKQLFEIVQRIEQRSEVLNTVDLRLQAIEMRLKELKEAVSNQFYETKTNLSEIGSSLDDTMNHIGEIDSKLIRLNQIFEQNKETIERQLKEIGENVSKRFDETKLNISKIINSLDETKSRIEEVDSKLLRQNQILEQYQETLKELLELNTRTSDLISQTEMLKIEIQRLRDVLNEPLDLSEWVDGNGTSKE